MAKACGALGRGFGGRYTVRIRPKLLWLPTPKAVQNVSLDSCYAAWLSEQSLTVRFVIQPGFSITGESTRCASVFAVVRVAK